ncbi:MAG: PilZ domain-containing protein [bacterium]|nr:PilZ domain-containing protein [bacterium]
MKADERRRDERVDLNKDYYYLPGDSNHEHECVVKNISITGACITAHDKLNADEILFLNIRASKEIVLKAKVVWRTDAEYGLLFLLDTSEEFENISFIMNNYAININK